MAESEKMKNNILEIRMLGDFSLRRGDSVLSGDMIRGKQIWTLLEYIMVNRHKAVSMDGLMQALWQNDEAEDPANALKNLAYRLRTVLKQTLGPADAEYIIYRHGVYVWNDAVPCIIDVDTMEEAYKESRQPGLNKDELQRCCKEIIALYKGNFMPHASFKEWIIPLAVYYQRLYMETVATYGRILIEDEHFKEAEELCRGAIAIDPFVEINHAMLIQALFGLKKRQQATEHYEHVNKFFRGELGVRPSETITEAYKAAASKTSEPEEDLLQVKNKLKEPPGSYGAICCNYEEFKMIYRLEARAAQRSGKSIFIALLTVKGRGNKNIPPQYAKETFAKIKDIVVSSLRKDDIVTEHGITQFLLLLSNLKYENANMVLSRLVEKVNETCVGDLVEVKGQIELLDPVEMEEWNAAP